MATIEEDYVSFEIAKLLKEKGFDWECEYFYDYYEKNDKYVVCSTGGSCNKEDYPSEYSMPTLQMAMKWLREVHHYYIQVMLDSWACGGHMGYYVVIQKTDSDFEMMLQDVVNDVFYKTYEQAAEAAIKYCLVNLFK